MVNGLRRQRDLFESPPTPTNIRIDAQEQVLELLKVLLTEALFGAAGTEDVAREDGDEQDHA